jgi:hypothetical protein
MLKHSHIDIHWPYSNDRSSSPITFFLSHVLLRNLILNYFEMHWHCDSIRMSKFREQLDEEDVSERLTRTIKVPPSLKPIASRELSRIIGYSNVHDESFAYPTDSNLLKSARIKLVESANSDGIELKHTNVNERQLPGCNVMCVVSDLLLQLRSRKTR